MANGGPKNDESSSSSSGVRPDVARARLDATGCGGKGEKSADASTGPSSRCRSRWLGGGIPADRADGRRRRHPQGVGRGDRRRQEGRPGLAGPSTTSATASSPASCSSSSRPTTPNWPSTRPRNNSWPSSPRSVCSSPTFRTRSRPEEVDKEVYKLPSVVQGQVAVERALQNLAREKNLMSKGAGMKQDLPERRERRPQRPGRPR